ncbi:PC4/YdbC family ssDNA-binding protein [Brevundimonas naejangsanensis]|uniref:PC4/YdbC family ssDNA-binding protein n=1 Tax=Brevundimonas naejangsanensis TaxID=588932 RepID=UPI000EE21225|nr:PC4/YdbC family ssDNA-binding protein [Brevundimonas naejangsanensis]HAC01375.1 hypothetical protein [Brevundimonas sp.]
MSGLPVTVRTLPLGDAAEVRLTLETVNNLARVDLRTWADDKLGAVVVRGPTKKGVSLPVEALPDLVAAVVEAEAKARALGLLEGQQ